MRHIRLPNRNLSTFKKQIGNILKKINKFDAAEKNKAITYLKQCIETDTTTSTENMDKEIVSKRRLRKRKSTCKSTRDSLDNDNGKEASRRKVHKKIKFANTNAATVKPFMLKCKVCGVMKKTKLQFFEHLEMHVQTPISCLKCKRSFNGRLSFEWHLLNLCHIRKIITKRTYKCNECPQEFRFKRHLDCHLEGHKRNNCTYCDMVLTHRKQLIRHMLNVHALKLETAIHKCEHCEKRYVKKRSLYYHMQQHSDNKPVCMECGKITDSPSDHAVHLKQHEDEKPFKCSKCNERFCRKQQYLSHLIRHDRYQCVTCKEGYASRTHAIRHKQRGHEVLGLHPRMECPYCPAAYHRRFSLQMHMMKHTDSKPTIKCKYCDKSFQSLYKYYRHCMTVMHDKQSPEINYVLCESCGKQFRKKYLLEQHLFRVHNIEKEPIACQFCEYKTHNKTNLERHVALHLNQQNQFICDQCGKSYSSIASLKDHISYMHVNEKQFQCNQCQKCFKRNSDLVRHIATHSDVRPHVCQQCNKTYKRSTHLKRHEESAHNTVPKTRKVQRLQPNEAGDLVPVPKMAKVEANKEIVQNNNDCLQQQVFIPVLQTISDIPSTENVNADFMYFNVIEL